MTADVIAFYPFSALTSILAVTAAFAAGRAIANAWQPWWLVAFAAIPLAVAARLLDIMLVQQTTSVLRILISLAMTAASAFAGFRWHRTRQMARQYPWLSGRANVTKV